MVYEDANLVICELQQNVQLQKNNNPTKKGLTMPTSTLGQDIGRVLFQPGKFVNQVQPHSLSLHIC